MYYIKGLVNGLYFSYCGFPWQANRLDAAGFNTVSDVASALSDSTSILGPVEIVRVDIVSQETVVS